MNINVQGMTEKDMVSDVLSGTKASLSDYTTAISECSNKSLKNALTQLRTEAEQFQEQLGSIAIQKGYYPTSPTASSQARQQIKSELSKVMTGGGITGQVMR